MNKLNWYVARLSTMSVPELGYRVGQFLQKETEKRSKKPALPKKAELKDVYQNSLNILKNREAQQFTAVDLVKVFEGYDVFSFFSSFQVDLRTAIDWHLDISSGKKFPTSFSKDIDIRSDQYGSAKAVWELNRLQFLLPLAAKYALSKSDADINHFIDIVESWVKDNPYLKGVNWYSNIEINIRLIVWYYCWQILFSAPQLQTNERFQLFIRETWLPTIYEHCVYSYANPSKYSSANNHLVAEYAGLFIASCCWKFKESDKWSVYAAKGLEQEIQLQYSENGINREEAAEYIQFITDFFLLPFSVAKEYGYHFSDAYKEKLHQIFDYIYNLLDVNKGYCKYGDEDDGKVLLTSINPHFDNFSSILVSAAVIFNDSKYKVIAGHGFDFKNWLLWGQKGRDQYESMQVADLARQSAFYQEGHFFFRKTDTLQPSKEIYLHFDAAPLGYLSIAAHGHADALAVVLHLDGCPIITDAGTYTYHTEKAWRSYFVSTLAHNTLCIDYQNQAVQAGPTMWLRHYKVTVQEIYQDKRLEYVTASHNGYHKIGCNHTRTVNFHREDEQFVIEDIIECNKANHTIILPWHLHPEVEVAKISDHVYDLKYKGAQRKCRLTCELPLTVITGQTEPRLLGWFSPSFMEKTPSPSLIGVLNKAGNEKINIRTIIEII